MKGKVNFRLLFIALLICLQTTGQNKLSDKFEKRIFGCYAGNMRAFEDFVKTAKEHGATHINLANEDLPLASWQYDVPGDPYPSWVITNIGLLKVATPKALRAYIPQEYSARLLSILKERCNILRKYNLKASLTTFEPQMLPEKVYVDHPLWRGPRVDHPARSRTPRWAPDIDNPEVLELYRESITILLKMCPEIEVLQLNTNDSGTGLSWSGGLYSGKSGNTTNKFRPVSERLFDFFSVFQEAAKTSRSSLDINFQWTREEFPERIAQQLGKGMAIENLEGPDAKLFATQVGSLLDYYQFFYPVTGIPDPLKFLEELEAGYNRDAKRIFIFFSDRWNKDLYFEIISKFSRQPTNGVISRLNLLTAIANEHAGVASPDLFQLWYSIGNMQNLSKYLESGGYIFYLGSVQQRWLTRPFVPFPEELKEDEKRYYRKFQFQARTEENANDLADLQASRNYAGWSGRYFVSTFMNELRGHISTARKSVAKLLTTLKNDTTRHRNLLSLDRKLLALHFLAVNAENAISYQAQLDKAKNSTAKPDLNPEVGTGSSLDRNAILETARMEIDNTALLIDLLETAEEPPLDIAPSRDLEDIRRLGPDLIQHLKTKLSIMNGHWLDYNRLFTIPNL